MLGSEFLGLSVLESGLPSSELPRGGLACLPMMPGLAQPGPEEAPVLLLPQPA